MVKKRGAKSIGIESLGDYVQDALNKGYGLAELRLRMLKEGFRRDDVERVIKRFSYDKWVMMIPIAITVVIVLFATGTGVVIFGFSGDDETSCFTFENGDAFNVEIVDYH